MSNISDKQLQANQQNALKGGPKTPEGKAIVAQNAIKHGIFAKDAVVNAGLVQESTEELEALKDSFFDVFKPCNLAEEEIVQNLVFNVWRKRRLMRAETGEIKKNNAYLSDIEDAIQRSHDELARDFSMLGQPKAVFDYETNNRLQINHFVKALELAYEEFETIGALSAETYQELVALFAGNDAVCLTLHTVRWKAKSDEEKNLALLGLQAHLEPLKEKRQYLESRAENEKINSSAANYVPDLKTTERLLKYSVSIDKQIKNALYLLRVMRGEEGQSEDSLAINL